jgi:RNA polymerase sigma-70 factor (ECF subfamily)
VVFWYSMDAIYRIPRASSALPTMTEAGRTAIVGDAVGDTATIDTRPADGALLSALVVDVDDAFPSLVDQHQDRLYTIALRMLGDPRDAEEATQDALLRAYRAMSGYDATRILDLRLRGWLATIVLNLCRNRLSRRADARRTRSLDDAKATPNEPIAAESASPSPIAARRDERDAWSARLLSLPVAYRAALILRHVDGLSYPEIAAALDRPEGTVKAQVHRGIGLLRSMLDDEARTHAEELTA